RSTSSSCSPPDVHVHASRGSDSESHTQPCFLRVNSSNPMLTLTKKTLNSVHVLRWSPSTPVPVTPASTSRVLSLSIRVECAYHPPPCILLSRRTIELYSPRLLISCT